MRVLARKFLMLAMLLLPLQLLASTIERISVQQLTDQSAAIFEARVTGVRNLVGQGKGNVHTLVTFEVLDMLKGAADTRTLELSFLGGTTAEGLSLIVTDMTIPRLGERGIYFAENPGMALVHPLSGWDQGRFLVEPALPGKHAAFIRTSAGQPVYGLDPGIQAPAALSTGKAAGVMVSPQLAGDAPLSVEEFKMQIREMIR